MVQTWSYLPIWVQLGSADIDIVSKEIIDQSQNIRDKFQVLEYNVGYKLRDSIADEYPDLKEYKDLISFSEALHKKIPEIDELKNRQKGFIYFDGAIFTSISIEKFEKENNIKFDEDLAMIGEYQKKTENPKLYSKWYTRENSLIAMQIMEYENTPAIERGIDLPFAIFDSYGGIVDIYYSYDNEELWAKLANSELIKNENAIDELMDWYGKKLDSLEIIWHKKKKLGDRKELRQFFDLAVEAWLGLAVSYFIATQENVSQSKRDLGLRMRARSIDYFELTDHVIQDTLRDFYPELGDLIKFIRIEEVMNDAIPSLAILEERKKHYIYFKSKLYSDNLDIFAKENNIKIERDEVPNDISELKGQIAMKGKVSGVVRVLHSKADISKIKEGEILVTMMTTPDYLPAMQKAAAFITDEGGITCHAAIVAREIGKPCIIGTKVGTKVLRDGDMVEVDANNGIVKIIK